MNHTLVRPLHTIDDVIAQLDHGLDRAQDARCRRGYFMALYRGVTARIGRLVAQGDYFDDNARMVRFDVIFARYYLQALDDWLGARPPSAPWSLAFEHTHDSLLIVQHLLLGMNAHIVFDLAQAAAETAPGASILALEADFNRINDVLRDAIDEVQDALAPYAPVMWLADIAGGPFDELLASQGLVLARDLAWESAKEIALARKPEARALAVQRCWCRAMSLGYTLKQRPRRLLRLVRLTEACHRRPLRVRDIIGTLRAAVS